MQQLAMIIVRNEPSLCAVYLAVLYGKLLICYVFVLCLLSTHI